MKNNLAKKEYYSEQLPFIVLFLIYCVIFRTSIQFGDDLDLIPKYQNLTIMDQWNLIVKDYFYWSSRVIVNGIIHVVLGFNRNIWVVLNALFAVVMGKSVSKLAVKSNKRVGNWVVVGFLLMYPVYCSGVAGWMTTTMTYFWPIATGFAALIPIRKIIDGEKIKKYQYVLYSLALVYACNEELELVVIFVVYGCFLIYMLANKKINKYYVVQCILIIASLVFTMTAPGNSNRSTSEIGHWFRDYEAMSFLDKVDIGITSALWRVWFGRIWFFIIVCALIAIIVWNKYDSILFRITSVLPVTAVIIYSLPKDFYQNDFGGFARYTVAVSRTGLINIQTCGDKEMLIELLLLIIPCVAFILSLYLIFENTWKSLFTIAILVGGTASRVAMAFSPTIWASGTRTFSAMFFAIIIIGVMLYSEIDEKKMLTDKKRKNIVAAILTISVFVMLDMFACII